MSIYIITIPLSILVGFLVFQWGFRAGQTSRPVRELWNDEEEREIAMMTWQFVRLARGHLDSGDPDGDPVTGSHQVDLREEARRRARFWPERAPAQKVNWEARVIRIRKLNALAIYAVQEGRELAAYDHLSHIDQLCSTQITDKGEIIP